MKEVLDNKKETGNSNWNSECGSKTTVRGYNIGCILCSSGGDAGNKGTQSPLEKSRSPLEK